MNPAQPAQPAPTVLSSRFEIRRKLGEGSFGTVYEALDRQYCCMVALKQLRRKNVDNLALFKQEFRSLVDIAHPNLVGLYELIASEEGDWLLCMEFIDGVDFLSYVSEGRASAETGITSDRMQTQQAISGQTRTLHPALPQELVATLAANLPQSLPLSPDGSSRARVFVQSGTSGSEERITGRSAPVQNFARLTQALIQLTTGINALHSAGKLHRDLKPSNIMVGADGRVVLLDFGLVIDAADAHHPEQLAGTPAYMAPEQVLQGRIGTAGDFYSVGVVLYEALTGQLPFEGSLAELVSDKISRDPVPPSRLRPDIPAALDSLCMQLLSRDPEARPSGEQVLTWLGGAVTKQPRALTQVPLVGRETQYQEIRSALMALEAKQSAVVLIEGLSGMGKTTLAKSFLRTEKPRHPQLLLLEGRCYEQESVPYKAFDGIIEELVRQLRDGRLLASHELSSDDISALTRLFPALQKLPGLALVDDPRVGKIADAREQRDRAFSALRKLLCWLGSLRPLVLFVDDLQWADEDSGALLLHILEPKVSPTMMVLLTLRADEIQTSPLLRWLHPKLLAMDGTTLAVHRVVLGPLSEAQAQKLAAALVPDHKASARLSQIIQDGRVGSPFLVAEVARFVGVPDGDSPLVDAAKAGDVDALLVRRMARLSAPSVRVMRVLAAAGRPVLRSVVRHVAALAADELSSLHQLRVGHFVRTRHSDGGEIIEPYHDRIRESVAAHLPKGDAIAIHRELALCLERLTPTDYETLAMHFKSAEVSDRASHYLRLAARQAARGLAFERAATLYRELLLERGAGDYSQRSAELGDVLCAMGHGRAAADAFLDAASRAKDDERLTLQSRAGAQLLRSGFLDEGLDVLQQVLAQLKIRLPQSTQLTAVFGFLRRQYIELRGLDCTLRDEKDCSPVDLRKLDVLHSVAVAYSMSHVMRASDVLGRLMAATLQVGEPFRLAQTLFLFAAFWSTRGVRKHAVNQRYVERAKEVGAGLQNPLLDAYLFLCTGVMAYLEGRFATARDDLREAERRLRAFPGVAWELEVAVRYSLSAQMLLGEYRELAQRSDKLLRDALGRDDAYAESTMRPTVLYFAELLRDDPRAAWNHIAAARARWKNKGFHGQHYWIECAKLEVLLYEGRFAEVQPHIEAEWVHLTLTQMTPYHEFARIAMLHRLGRAKLVSALRATSGRRAALRAVDAICTKLSKEDAAWARALSLHLRAGRLVLSLGPCSQTREAITSALSSLTDVGLWPHAASLRDCAFRIGMTDLVTPSAHQELLAALRERGVLAPHRLLQMTLPIFPQTP